MGGAVLWREKPAVKELNSEQHFGATRVPCPQPRPPLVAQHGITSSWLPCSAGEWGAASPGQRFAPLLAQVVALLKRQQGKPQPFRGAWWHHTWKFRVGTISQRCFYCR